MFILILQCVDSGNISDCYGRSWQKLMEINKYMKEEMQVFWRFKTLSCRLYQEGVSTRCTQTSVYSSLVTLEPRVLKLDIPEVTGGKRPTYKPIYTLHLRCSIHLPFNIHRSNAKHCSNYPFTQMHAHFYMSDLQRTEDIHSGGGWMVPSWLGRLIWVQPKSKVNLNGIWPGCHSGTSCN